MGVLTRRTAGDEWPVDRVERDSEPELLTAVLPRQWPPPLSRSFRRAVIAWLEPSLFVADCQSRELLEAAGVTVAEIPELAERARRPISRLAL